MMDIELCGLGATVVIWYGSGVLSPAFGFYPRRWPHSHLKCVCPSICMWECMFCNLLFSVFVCVFVFV